MNEKNTGSALEKLSQKLVPTWALPVNQRGLTMR
jgi:hypothetical protein